MWAMGHASDTIQSSVRFSHQTIQPLPPYLAVCLRGCLYVHSYATEVVGYFTSFPAILSLVDSVCLQVGCIFRQRACSSALEKGFLVSHFLVSLSFGVSKLALIFDFDSYSRAEWGCVTVGAPRLWQPEVRTDINHR